MQFQDIPWVIFIAVITVGGGYMIINQVIQERAQNRIEKYLGSYQARVREYGLKFSIFTRASDPTPGSDFVVEFMGPTVKAEVTPAQALRFLKTVEKGNPDISYLEKKSKWPSSPILF